MQNQQYQEGTLVTDPHSGSVGMITGQHNGITTVVFPDRTAHWLSSEIKPHMLYVNTVLQNFMTSQGMDWFFISHLWNSQPRNILQVEFVKRFEDYWVSIAGPDLCITIDLDFYATEDGKTESYVTLASGPFDVKYTQQVYKLLGNIANTASDLYHFSKTMESVNVSVTFGNTDTKSVYTVSANSGTVNTRELHPEEAIVKFSSRLTNYKGDTGAQLNFIASNGPDVVHEMLRVLRIIQDKKDALEELL